MTGLGLLDLPVEILIKIIQLAIPPMVPPVMSHDPLDTAYEESLPFETSFTVAQELGSLWEIGLVIETAPGCYINSFQQFGPSQQSKLVAHNISRPLLSTTYTNLH